MSDLLLSTVQGKSPSEVAPSSLRPSKVLHGISAAPGIAIGKAFLFQRIDLEAEKTHIPADAVKAEIERLQEAVRRADRQLEKIKSITREKVGEESADIFEAQQMMLHDVSVHDAIEAYIKRELVKADYAVHHVIEKHRLLIASSASEYIREREGDLRDVQDRIILHLRRQKLVSDVDDESIIVSKNLTAADVILFSRRKILGCATDFGGQTSHVAIMARALSLPSVVGLHQLTDYVETGDMLVIDGIKGCVLVNPEEDVLAAYYTRQERYRRMVMEERQLVPLPSETLDHTSVALRANLEFVDELEHAHELGAQGIGLFRTEIHFLMQGKLKFSEEEQYTVYRTLSESMLPHPVTIRVLDLGGDKMLPMAHREHNPFLGWRGIRILLDRPVLLRSQLRAIIRANQHGNIRLMVPMVTTLSEIREFKAHLNACTDELSREGYSFKNSIKLGVMVEVPSVALLAEQFAREVDFFSIGTNDLTQYVLAVDRGNDLVSDLYQTLHPAVLRLIKHVVDTAQPLGIPVSICGEMAANPRAVPLLVGMGLTELSASPTYLPRMKRIIRAMKRSEGAHLLERAINLGDPQEVEALLDAWLQEHHCSFLFLESD